MEQVALKNFLSENGAKRRRIALSVSVELEARFRNVMLYKIADYLSKQFRFFQTQPFLNLYLFEKAHIVFRPQMIIDTMIVINRLKHRVLDRSCFIYQTFSVL